MEIVMMRADERLVHGQILTEWCLFLKASHLLIVDDELAENVFMSNLYRTMIPIYLTTIISKIHDVSECLKMYEGSKARIFLLTKTPETFVELLKDGVKIKEITLADRMYFPNKVMVPRECKIAINKLLEADISVVAQVLPEDEKIKLEKYDL